MAPRNFTHVRETNSRNWLREKIDAYYPSGDALIREWSGQDYGIDFVLELFEDGIPTGKLAFIQVKGTRDEIKKLKTVEMVSCPNVSVCSLNYAVQKRIPFMLVYVSLANPHKFYYIDLQHIIDNVLDSISENQKDVSVRIPIENCSETNFSGFFDIINEYYLD